MYWEIKFHYIEPPRRSTIIRDDGNDQIRLAERKRLPSINILPLAVFFSTGQVASLDYAPTLSLQQQELIFKPVVGHSVSLKPLSIVRGRTENVNQIKLSICIR